MAPKSWADDAQYEFLMSYFPLYEKYHSTTKRYQPFWDVLYPAYTQKWPILPSGTNPEDLEGERFDEYSLKLAKLYKEWYRWRCSNRSRGTTTTVTTKEMKDIYAPGTRSAKEYEIFVKQNPDQFQPKYEAECALQGVSGRDRLPVWHKIAGEMWEKATPEEKAAVQAQILADKDEEPAPSTPSEYQKYVYLLSFKATAHSVIEILGQAARNIEQISHPSGAACGQILATTLQFGDKPETPLFSSTWADHDTILVERLAKFAGRYEFPPDVCSERSLQPKQVASSSGSNTIGDDATSAASSADRGVMGDAALSGGSADNATTSGRECPGGSVLDTIDLPTGSTSSATSITSVATETPPVSNTNGPPPFDAISTNDSQAKPAATSLEQAAAEFVNSNSCSFDVQEPWDFSKWADPEILETITQLNAPEDHIEPCTTHAPVVPGSAFGLATTDAPCTNTTGATLLGFQLNGALASETVAGHKTSVLNASVVTPHDPVAPQPVPPATPATLALPLTASTGFQGPPPTQLQAAVLPNHTAIPSKASPLTLPTMAGHVPVPTIDHVLQTAPDMFPPVTFDFLSTPNMAGMQTFNSFHSQDQHRRPQTDENTPPAPPNTHNQHHATLGDPPTQELQNGIRRSNRPPAPSTRVDKLNEIGTNIVPPKRLTEDSDAQEPIWFQPSREYLMKIDLGPLWSGLVEKWAEYECAKGWKSGRGLPAKHRPEEWQQWASKSRHGARNYQHIPTALDPNELGIAITKWVSSFTPADFGRTGPHGLFSLLGLTYWWGIGAKTPSSWNEDSRPQWCTLVQDLIHRLDELLKAGHTAAKRGREDYIENETQENKRPRTD
ncbi:hypothetical protein MD484_g1361, partial [Candolleomyces efflorescens]